MILHLRAAVEQLYAAPPTRFTALRSELVAEARSAGERDLAASIGALRKPTTAAWAVNHFVRSRPDELEQLRSFAELLREAQRTLDADQLRLLGRERATRVDAVAERIAEEAAQAGQRLGAGVAQEVRDTLTALIADEDAEASVLTGSLVRALTYSGFGSVDVADVVAMGDDDAPDDAVDDDAATSRRPALSVLRGGGGRGGGGGGGGEAETGADDEEAVDPVEAVDLEERRRSRRAATRTRLQSALDAARGALRSADRQVGVLSARQEEVTEGIADLERRLATARARLEKVTAQLDEAGGIRDRREAEEEAAQQALDAHDDANDDGHDDAN
ncbi:hypothetical protein GCM10023258_19690 [Terrabacter aeriphilus]|uniref:Transposase n=1 Tax=Terrabacter aeriphilus TaxID=515662 RepID=A0ABP9JAN8_9MICO